MSQSCVWKGLAAGAAAGVLGSWAMNHFQALLSRASQSGRQQQQQQSSDEAATVKAAREVSRRVFHQELADSEKGTAGEIAHYAMGVVSGAMYGTTAAAFPAASAGLGLAFGTALWLIADETMVPALGLSKGPMEYPISSHASALASHLVYGVTTDLARRLLLCEL
jgi:putative membrane protein